MQSLTFVLDFSLCNRNDMEFANWILKRHLTQLIAQYYKISIEKCDNFLILRHNRNQNTLVKPNQHFFEWKNVKKVDKNNGNPLNWQVWNERQSGSMSFVLIFLYVFLRCIHLLFGFRSLIWILTSKLNHSLKWIHSGFSSWHFR